MNPQDLVLGHGGLDSPVDPNSWTLASVGAQTTAYADTIMLDTAWMKASNQGKRSCCVGCSGEEAVRQIIYLTTGKACNPGTADELSWRFVYALAKCLEGTIQPDGTDYRMFARTQNSGDGTYPALVAKILRKYGVPLAKYCPNDVTLSDDVFVFNRNINNIPQVAFIDALNRRAGADLGEPVSADGIRKALTYAQQNKGAVMILRRIGDSYWKDVNGNTTWDKSKILPIRVPIQFVGGHEESLTGIDKEPGTGRDRVYWLNHWSPTWADNGRGWEYLDVWLPFVNEIRVIVPSIPAVDGFKYHFTTTMSPGQKGADVVALQHVLKLEGVYNAAFTGFYGPITQAAVLALQEKYSAEILRPANLVHGTGLVGPATLAWIVKNYGN
jgi:hypothetical protein